VVALVGFLEELQVLFELFRRRPRGSVDASQLRLLLVATPVGASDAQQLEELEILGRAHVRPPAEVDEVARPVQADLIAFDLVVDELELVVLADSAKFVERLRPRNDVPHEGPILLRDPPHA